MELKRPLDDGSANENSTTAEHATKRMKADEVENSEVQSAGADVASDSPAKETANDQPTEEKEEGAAVESQYRMRVSLFKHTSRKDIEKHFKALDIPLPHQVKKSPAWAYAFLSYKSEGDRDKAMEMVRGTSLKKHIIQVEVASSRERDQVANMRGRTQKEVVSDATVKPLTEEELQELLAAQVTPLHAMPYEEQLNTKAGLHRKALFNFKKRLLGYLPRDYLSNDKYEVNVTDQSIENLTPEVRSLIQLSWLKPALEANNKIPCPLLAPVASPDVDEYRTKVEYSFGWNQNGEIAVGFLSGLFKEGQVSIVNPQHTKHVSAAAKAIANALQGFLRAGGGGLDVYDRVAKKGFWRMALVRTPLTGENMVAVQFDRSKVPPALVDEALKALQDHLQGSVDRGDCKIATLLVTECDGVFNGIKNDAKMKVLWGTGYIHEELLGLKFRVSPTAFFQVNTKAAEVLYSKVREWCHLDEIALERHLRQAASSDASGDDNSCPKPIVAEEVDAQQEKRDQPDGDSSALDNKANEQKMSDEEAAVKAALALNLSKTPGTIVLDLCCGTGTIGLALHPAAKHVIGCDITASAIEDANFNAKLNNADNVTFVAQRVEHCIKHMLANVGEHDDVVAVLDPPRAGVHGDVIRAVRACEKVKRVVFVACDAEQSLGNLVDLCRPTANKFKGKPFIPLRAQTVDLFPHTSLSEMIVELRR